MTVSIPPTLLFYWDSVPNPDAPRGLCVLHVFAVANTRTRLSQSPQPCYFIGALSQTLTLRAAFASSTYLLLQIPGPACLNPPNPLFKGAHQASVRTRAHATASLFFGRHLMMPYLIHQSHFSRGDQGLRAFHHRPASLPANSSPASDDALSILRAELFRLPSPEKVYRC